MKNTLLSLALVAGLLAGSTGSAVAQDKDGKAPKEVRKFKFHPVNKDTKKQAKKYEKEGWMVVPGELPLKQQLDESYRRKSEKDNEGFPKYITSHGSSVAGTQAAAEMQATELAKNRLVGLIETQMKDVITSNVANDQLDQETATTVTKTIETSTNSVSKKLGRIMPLFKMYRNVGKNIEVQVEIGYNYDMVRKQLLEEMKTKLKFDTESQRKKFDKFLNAEAYKSGEIINSDDKAND